MEATQQEADGVKLAAVNALVASDGPAADTAAAITQVLQDNQGEEPDVKEALVTAVATEGPPIAPPTDTTGLWWALVIGLLVLLFATLGGVLYAILDANNKTSADKVLIMFTPLLTGLLGLFAPSPREVSGGGQSGG
jgi:hypothetical protein